RDACRVWRIAANDPWSNAWRTIAVVFCQHDSTRAARSLSRAPALRFGDLCPAVHHESSYHGPWLTCAHTNASVGSRTDAWSTGRRAVRPALLTSTASIDVRSIFDRGRDIWRAPLISALGRTPLYHVRASRWTRIEHASVS